MASSTTGSDLGDMLARVDAPEPLVSRAQAEEWSFEAAWGECDRGDHRIWIAACGGAPIEVLLEAAAVTVLRALEGFSDGTETLLEAIEGAVAGEPPDVLIAAAEACETLADGGVGGYRAATAPGYGALARAAALVARAGEGLAAGEAAREAGRLDQASRAAAYLGVGQQIVLPAAAGPARLDVLAAAADPAAGAFHFSVAALAEAVAEAGLALAAGASDPEGAISEARARLDAIVRVAIEDRE